MLISIFIQRYSGKFSLGPYVRTLFGDYKSASNTFLARLQLDLWPFGVSCDTYRVPEVLISIFIQ